MRLTKLEHACVRLEKDGVILAIDPSVWSMPEALVGASAVLVTHEHFDHLDGDGLRAALDADAGLQLWTNQSVASQFAGFSRDQVHIVDHGDAFSVAGFGIFGALPVFWTLPTAFLSGAAAAGGIAIINSIGNLAGFVGPSVMGLIKDSTGSFTNGLLVLAGAAILAMAIVLALGHDTALERTPARDSSPAE